MTEANKVTGQELENVAGGASPYGHDTLHDLGYYVKKTVCNVIKYDKTACLTLRRTPNGQQIPGVGWQNGDSILVHATYREDGWYLAYDPRSGKFGYVNPNNVA